MRKYIYIIFSCFFSFFTFSQILSNEVAQIDLLYNCIDFGEISEIEKNIDRISDVIKDTTLFKVKELHNSGYVNVEFYLINYSSFYLKAYLEDNLEVMNYLIENNLILEDTYVLAYFSNSNRIYRIKGFYVSEIKLFLSDFINANISNPSFKEKIENRKKFLKSFDIEGVDSDKLYHLINKKKGGIEYFIKVRDVIG